MSAYIYLIEDDPMLRIALADFLDFFPSFYVCGTARTAQEALEEVAVLGVDIVLVDVSLPDGNGVDLVRDLQVVAPAARCIVLSGYVHRNQVQQAMNNGAHGYVVKGSPQELVEAIRQVVAGYTYFSQQVWDMFPTGSPASG